MKKVITIFTIIVLFCFFSVPSFAYKYHNFDLSYDYFSSSERSLAESNGIEATALYKIGYQDGYHYTFDHYKDKDYDKYSNEDWSFVKKNIDGYFYERSSLKEDSDSLQISELYFAGSVAGRISAEKELGIATPFDRDCYNDGYEDGNESGFEEGMSAAEEENGTGDYDSGYDKGWEDGYEQAKEEYSVPDEEEENERQESKWNIGSIVASVIVGGILVFFIGGKIYVYVKEAIQNKKEK